MGPGRQPLRSRDQVAEQDADCAGDEHQPRRWGANDVVFWGGGVLDDDVEESTDSRKALPVHCSARSQGPTAAAQ